jgi:hypothetical protein
MDAKSDIYFFNLLLTSFRKWEQTLFATVE